MSFKNIILFLCLLCSFSSANADFENEQLLIGRWKFTRYNYQGRELPLPNPNLNLFYEFYNTGTSRLWWTRSNEEGFCERIGSYSFDGSLLSDQVLWVNSKNNIDCGKDPDMLTGRKVSTKAIVLNNELRTELTLKGEPFIYIWEKQE